jgi:hypothetical protein
VYDTWFSRYPCYGYLIHNNKSEFKLHFHALCNTYGIKHTPTSAKNPQVNAILEHIHTVLTNMLCTAELDLAKLVKASDIDVFLSNNVWIICSTYHTVLKASPGSAILGQNMLFEIPFIVDWKKIGEHRQQQTDLNTPHENKGRIDYDYRVGQKIILQNKGILCRAEPTYLKDDPWTITPVHTYGTIMVQCRYKYERINFWRLKPFVE